MSGRLAQLLTRQRMPAEHLVLADWQKRGDGFVAAAELRPSGLNVRIVCLARDPTQRMMPRVPRRSGAACRETRAGL
jgi:hypothetical protein